MPAPYPFLPFSSNSGACPLLITHWKPGPSSSEPSCCHSDFCPQSSFVPQNSTFLACWVVLSLLSTLPWGGAVTITSHHPHWPAPATLAEGGPPGSFPKASSHCRAVLPYATNAAQSLPLLHCPEILASWGGVHTSIRYRSILKPKTASYKSLSAEPGPTRTKYASYLIAPGLID